MEMNLNLYDVKRRADCGKISQIIDMPIPNLSVDIR